MGPLAVLRSLHRHAGGFLVNVLMGPWGFRGRQKAADLGLAMKNCMGSMTNGGCTRRLKVFSHPATTEIRSGLRNLRMRYAPFRPRSGCSSEPSYPSSQRFEISSSVVDTVIQKLGVPGSSDMGFLISFRGLGWRFPLIVKEEERGVRSRLYS
jgi:hypothetical protein